MWQVIKVISVAILLFIIFAIITIILNKLFPTIGIYWWFLLYILIIGISYSIYTEKQGKKDLVLLAMSRLHLSKADYVQIVQTKGYELDYIDACYDIINNYFKARWGKLDFSIYPEDDIFRLYRFDDEDIIDEMKKLFKKFNLTWLSNAEFEKLNEQYAKANIYHLLAAIQVARNSQNKKEG